MTQPNEIDFRPRDPQRRDQPIGLIGCGGITEHHLSAYRTARYPVVALCDLDRRRAEQRRDTYFPHADVYDDFQQILDREDIRVVDVATHPASRESIMREAIAAGKHVLSQKPFALDLDAGQQLVELAEARGVLLAVNQNARWAPHFRYLLESVEAGVLGQLATVHLSVHWDHSWVQGTPFEQIHDLILYDYAIHWFDLVNALLTPRIARRVYATTSPSPWQEVAPHLQAQAIIEFDDVQVSLTFDGNTRFQPQDRTYVTGSLGTIYSCGPNNDEQQLTIQTAAGIYRPPLAGHWFPDGFHGTMGELLCAIEENRVPTIDARRNLDSLALCFAAVASAREHAPKRPGEVRRLSAS